MALAALGTALACNAVLGIESGTFEPRGDASAPADTGPPPPPDADPEACVDLDRNPRHCGACGHDCLGGACVSGTCQPFLVARDEGARIAALTVGGGRAYYIDRKSGEVRRVPLTGGTPTLFQANSYDSSSYAARSLAFHNGRLFFSTQFSVLACTPEDCRYPTSAASQNRTIGAFAIDRAGAIATIGTGPAARVLRCASPPCLNEAGFEVVSASEDQPARVAVAGNAVGWTVFGTNGANALRLGAVGATPRTVVSAGGSLFLAMTADQIILGNPDQSIMSVAYDGSGQRTLARIATTTESLIIDGDLLYFGDRSANAVLRVPIDGSSPAVPIATRQASPGDIAVDEKGVSWVNDDDSTIWRLAK